MKNRRGQIGPQGMEDLPMAVMAFAAAVTAIMILISIVSSHVMESKSDDRHKAGKRLAETLAGGMFKSEYSRSYGNGVLDGGLIGEASDGGGNLTDRVGGIEYDFRAVITAGAESWSFGPGNPGNSSALAYSLPVTVLEGDSLKNGRIVVKIW